MITADKLTLLTNLPAVMLTTAIQQAGYKKDKFQTAKFLGMTNGNQFCYSVTYVEDGEVHKTKVFVNYDPTADKVSVDY
jgi:hypothetical protein